MSGQHPQLDRDLWARAKKATTRENKPVNYALATYIYKNAGGKFRHSKKLKSGEILVGGRGDSRKLSDFDPREVKLGMEVEAEHSPDEKIRKEIVMDHLSEDPKYYTYLTRLEKMRQRRDPEGRVLQKAETGERFLLLKAARAGLTAVQKMVQRGGKTFTTTVWRKLSEDVGGVAGTLISFFKVQSKEGLKGLPDREYDRLGVQDRLKVDKETWQSHFIAYWAERDKWDKIFSKAKVVKVYPKGETEGRKIAVKESISAERPSGKSGLRRDVMRFIWEQYGGKKHVEDGPSANAAGTPGGSVGGSGTGTGGVESIHAVPPGITGRYADEGVLLAREELTKFPERNYLSSSVARHLKQYQRDFVNLSMERFAAGKKGILNMDGTGAGKTRQEIALAQTYRKEHPNEAVLIVTKSATIIDDAFRRDALEMGADLLYTQDPGETKGPGIYITTYRHISKAKNPGLVIFDESHSLKNYGSAQTKAGLDLMNRAKNVASFSATPIDKAVHMGHVCSALGMNIFRTMESLGYRLQDTQGGGKEFQTSLSATEVAQRIGALFDSITDQGLAVKREVPLTNLDLQIEKVALSGGWQREWDNALLGLRNPKTKGIALLGLRNIQEMRKVDAAVDRAQKAISEGKRPIIFGGTVEGGKLLDSGALKVIARKLDEAGISYSSVFGSASTQSERARRTEEIRKFQAGETQVLIGTPESGGTGTSLDDTVGNAPRSMIILSPPFSAVELVQNVGRINRMNTKSRAEAVILSSDEFIDKWNTDIIAAKVSSLGGAVQGDYAKLSIEEMEAVQYMTDAERKEFLAKSKKERKSLLPQKTPQIIAVTDTKVPSVETKITKQDRVTIEGRHGDITVTSSGDAFHVKLDYAVPELVAQIKMIPGRHYDGGAQIWHIPETAGLQLKEVLRKREKDLQVQKEGPGVSESTIKLLDGFSDGLHQVKLAEGRFFVRVPFDRKDKFKAAMGTYKWNGERKVWEVPLSAAKKLATYFGVPM